MDKYEFNLKIEQLKKLINEEDYLTALKIVESIDWNRVRNTNLLTTAANVYEKNDRLEEAKDMLILAFERAPVGKHILFKLTELSCRTGNLDEAEDYYHEFRAADATDIGNYTLQYMILKARHAPYERQLMPLERYCEIDPDEKWLYELATVYEFDNRIDDCVRVCDRLALLYGGSKYGLKALRLKSRYANLTDVQRNILYPRSVPISAETMRNGYADGEGGAAEAGAAGYAAAAEAGTGSYDAASANVYGGSSQQSAYGYDSQKTYAAQTEAGYAQTVSSKDYAGYAEQPDTAYPQQGAADAAYEQPSYTQQQYTQPAGVYDDREYNAAVQNAGIYAYTEQKAESAQESQELDLRKSDALAAERYQGEDEAFDAYVRMCASNEGRPAAAKVEVVNGTASVQSQVQPEADEGVQMAFDFSSGAARVIDEPYAPDGARTDTEAGYTEAPQSTGMQAQTAQTLGVQAQAVQQTPDAAGTLAPQASLASSQNPQAQTSQTQSLPTPGASAASSAQPTLANAQAQQGQGVSVSPAPQAAGISAASALAAAGAAAAAQSAAGIGQAAGTYKQDTFAASSSPLAQGITRSASAPAQVNFTQQPSQEAVQPAAMPASESKSPLAQGISQQPTQRPLVPHQQLKSDTPVKGLHMIVEAATEAEGLNIAIDELKNIHEEKGIEHASVKTSADKLNKNGISNAIISKVSGKDFVIEHAGALSAENIAVIYNFICQDKTGTIVVLIDTPDGLDRIEELEPRLFDICDYISDIDDEEELGAPTEQRTENGVTSRQTHPGKDADEMPADDGEPYDEASDDDEPYDEADDAGYDEDSEADSNINASAYDASAPAQDGSAHADRQLPDAPDISEDRTPAPVKRSNGKVSAERYNNVREVSPAQAGAQMEIDDFAQYCAQYAASIDCSITGTSMLALYERIELMEENDIPLTRTNAEQLIEEAADRAEKPPIGKRLTSLFKSKYDKNGLLILKEDDFIY